MAGIFVGGQSRRMRGVPKGLLQPQGGLTIVETLARELEGAGIRRIVMVGDHEAYRRFGWDVLPDVVKGQGPLSGLLSLLQRAQQESYEFALAIACDMPFVERRMLARLVHEAPEAAALAPRRERWEPLCARYRVHDVLPIALALLQTGRPRMIGLLEELGSRCRELALLGGEAATLRDWDAFDELPEGVTFLGQPPAGQGD